MENPTQYKPGTPIYSSLHGKTGYILREYDSPNEKFLIGGKDGMQKIEKDYTIVWLDSNLMANYLTIDYPDISVKEGAALAARMEILPLSNMEYLATLEKRAITRQNLTESIVEAEKIVEPEKPRVGETMELFPKDEPEPPKSNAHIETHHHTKRGKDVYIVSGYDQMPRNDFLDLANDCKKRGGWYCRAWNGSPKGFAFLEHETAVLFLKDFFGMGEPPTTNEPRPGPTKKSTPAPDNRLTEKFRVYAESLQKDIDNCFSDRQENTPKRMCQAAHKRIDGRRYQRAQKGFNVLADLYEKGECPYILKSIYTKKEMLALVGCGMDCSQGGHYSAPIELDKPHDKSEKAALLWSLISNQSPEDRKKEELHRQIKELQFKNIPGYFPTPRAVIELMIERSDIEEGNHILEPSAGSGAIADAIKEKCPGITIEVSEVNYTLQEILKAKGYELVSPNFLEYLDNFQYDRILMNPPFENQQDIDHVRKAYAHLFEGGRLVSIMSPAPFFRSDKKAVEFREWFDNLGGERVDLPENSFKQSGTGVASIMIILDKE